jgi:hypothetical protein
VDTAPPREKDPRRVKMGVAGMRARWGPYPRSVRPDTLAEPYRIALYAILDADDAAKAKAASAVDPETALPEVHCHARPAA